MTDRSALQFGPQAALCRQSVCISCLRRRLQRPGPCVPHHDPSRGAGGLDRDTVPLCNTCHEEVHRVGAETFWARVGLPVADVVARMREGHPILECEYWPA